MLRAAGFAQTLFGGSAARMLRREAQRAADAGSARRGTMAVIRVARKTRSLYA